jgi:hypothetical protein
VLLLAVLVVSTPALVPGQSPRVLGAELLGSGLVTWLILVVIHVGAVRGRSRRHCLSWFARSCWPRSQSCRC